MKLGVKSGEGIEEEVEDMEWGLDLIQTYNMYT